MTRDQALEEASQFLRRIIEDASHQTGMVLRQTPLSKREEEVALLVAQGLSNREIAKRLFISERTADTHVQHILNKLGFSSRTQIAGWMARHDGTLG